jgi:CHAT domain-containing protein/Tfp pilus assembly protein PilF
MRRTVLGLLAVAAALPSAAAAQVVVEEVTPHFAAAEAGIQPGDVILSWSRAAAPPENPSPVRGRVESPFDLAVAEAEQWPRGAITLEGRHGDSDRAWQLPPVGWSLRTRPPLSPEVLALYDEGRRLVTTEKVQEGLALLDTAAARSNASLDQLWLRLAAAHARSRIRLWPEVDASYEAAVLTARKVLPPAALAELLRDWASTFERRNAWDQAADRYRQALALDRDTARLDLAAGLDFHLLGILELRRGHLTEGEAAFKEALAVRERDAPRSFATAQSLTNLGLVAYRHSDLDRAEGYYKRALAIEDALAPESRDTAATLANWANVFDDRGDPRRAEELGRRALAIERKLTPDSPRIAGLFNNLGILARDRGDIAAAETYYRDALEMQESKDPEGLDVALTLANLAVVLSDRGDYEAAEANYRRALAIREKVAPDRPETATVLEELGAVLSETGQLEAAEAYYQRALDFVKQHIGPESLLGAAILEKISQLAVRRGSFPRAEQLARQAVEMVDKLGPGSLKAADAQETLGDALLQNGDTAAARASYELALDIRQRFAPGSAFAAESHHALGIAYRDLPLRSAEHLCRAADIIDERRAKVGGWHEAKAGFAAQYASYHHDCVEALLGQQRRAEAFHVLERSRARLLLDMLAERDTISKEIPEDLERERRVNNRDYDEAQAALAELNPSKDGQKIEGLLATLRTLRDKREQIMARIREASPRLADLHYPQPLRLPEVRAALDPGTVFLAYSVGPLSTILFAVDTSARPGEADGLSVVTIPLGEAALSAKVEAFRGRIQRIDRAGVAQQAAELYDLLLRPIDPLISSGRRVVVSPDGPLYGLPFSALVRRNTKDGAAGTLVEWKPLHVVASATVYAQLKRSRREKDPRAVSIVAFGDPKYPGSLVAQADTITSPEVRAAVREGLALAPLPATRDEVLAIAALYPGASTTYLGEDAREEKVKSVDPSVRYLHLACHGVLNERRPLDSGLALTIPEKPKAGEENGLLQAWEILESVRLDADLVTLSACDTGLGKQAGGEGLLGLARAFQYAGARSVLASLWNVSDRSTAELMKHFYGYLKAGKTKDEALRAAQIDMIHSARSHPFHWAAFELIGDWR